MKKLLLLISFLLTTSINSYAAPVDVNSADAQLLADSLNGVGPALAAAIVAHREQNGPYQTVEDLLKVKGIGPVVLEKNRGDIQLGGTVGAGKR